MDIRIKDSIRTIEKLVRTLEETLKDVLHNQKMILKVTRSTNASVVRKYSDKNTIKNIEKKGKK